MSFEERRRGQRRAVGRPGERRNASHDLIITEEDMAFVRTCPCDRCGEYRRRLLICQEHGVLGCMECSGHLLRTTAEALWSARYHLRDAYEEFLGCRSRVKRFAATCPCSFCDRWRGRFMAAVAGGRKDRTRRLQVK